MAKVKAHGRRPEHRCEMSADSRERILRTLHAAANRGRVVLVHRVGHLPGPLAGGSAEVSA